MSLHLYNTLTRRKEEFVPLDPQNVRMYVCGPTVYDYAHIGNARPVIVFDVLFRLLRHLYRAERVTYVRNITDIDDKINARARREGIGSRAIAERYARQYEKDVRLLRTRRPTVEPRATEYLEQIRLLIQTLVNCGCAYVGEDHVLFDVFKMPGYGKLSNQSLESMMAGARVDVAPYKRNALDFVLWKPSQEGELAFPSPCGIEKYGRPGWHIECSAMSGAILGKTFDIHGGGIDLMFPHHENEIAQSECAHSGEKLANYWLHNGFLQVEGEKMSKSSGNFLTINELLRTRKFGGRRWDGGVLKFAMLQVHYRQPLDFTLRALELAEHRLERWKEFASERVTARTDQGIFGSFMEYLHDDLNTPEAFTYIDRVIKSSKGNELAPYTVYRIIRFMNFANIHSGVYDLARELRNVVTHLSDLPPDKWEAIANAAHEAPLFPTGNPRPSTRLLGYVSAFEQLLRQRGSNIYSAFNLRDVQNVKREVLKKAYEIQEKIDARNAARAAKNFAEADRIRNELLEQGIQLDDTASGTVWKPRP